MTLTDIAPLGDNQFPQGEAITESLRDAHHKLITRRDELIDAELRVPMLPLDSEDPEAEKSITEFIRQISACAKAADASRVGAKEPYLEGGRRVDGFFKGIMEPLANLDRRVRVKLTAYKDACEKRRRVKLEQEAWLQREAEARARKEAEDAAARVVDEKSLATAIEAESKIAEAALSRVEADRAAAVPAADLTRSRSDYGALSSLTRVLDFESPDRATLDLEKLRDHFNDDAFDKAVRSYMRANSDAIKASLDGGARHEFKGVRFFMSSRTTVR
jgi:hypothetical protein